MNELGLTYRTIFTDFQKGDHRKEEFLRVCPNGRIPAIIDHLNNDLPVWESGSILWYLVTRYDPEAKLWSRDLNTQTQIMSWLMLQVSGHGVIQGQAFWFKFFHPEHVESAVQRYVDECRRVYGVLEVQLAEKREQLMDSFGEEGEDGDGETREEIGGDEGLEEKRLSEMPIWLVGNHVTICDLSYLTWSRTAHRIGIDLETEFPGKVSFFIDWGKLTMTEVSRWINAMMARPKVAEALKPPLE